MLRSHVMGGGSTEIIKTILLYRQVIDKFAITNIVNAILSIINILPNRVAKIYVQLKTNACTL